MLIKLFFIGFIGFLCLNEKVTGVPVNDQRSADELSEIKTENQMVQLQQQLEKLQKDLAGLKSGGKNQLLTSSQNNVQNWDMNSRKIDLDNDNGNQQQRRGVGWQPLKRVAEPNTPNQGSFKLQFNDETSLRQEMVDAIENHLLRDLETARKYGIEPQEILQDLRQKHN